MDDRRADKVLHAFTGRSFAIDHAKRRGNSIYFTSRRLSEFTEFRGALAACGEISLLHEGGRMNALTIDVCGHRPWRHKK